MIQQRHRQRQPDRDTDSRTQGQTDRIYGCRRHLFSPVIYLSSGNFQPFLAEGPFAAQGAAASLRLRVSNDFSQNPARRPAACSVCHFVAVCAAKAFDWLPAATGQSKVLLECRFMSATQTPTRPSHVKFVRNYEGYNRGCCAENSCKLQQIRGPYLTEGLRSRLLHDIEGNKSSTHSNILSQ